MKRLPIGVVAVGLIASLTVTVLLTPGCKSDPFDEAQTLGGVSISATVLNRGFAVYRRNCAVCHGLEGEGATSQREGPPARDLTLGYYKFGSVRAGELPTDADFKRIIRLGLGGTAMPPFTDLSDSDVAAVTHYIKAFSTRWSTQTAGKPIPVVDDPWVGNRTGGIERGYFVYHATAQCWACHPAYSSKPDILAMSRRLDQEAGKAPRISMKFRPGMDHGAVVDTRYGKVLPPNFLSDSVPAAKGLKGLYRSIGAGIGGTEMPSWFDRLSPRDLWAVVHYVRELVRLRGTPGAAKMQRGMDFPKGPSIPLESTGFQGPDGSSQGERKGRKK